MVKPVDLFHHPRKLIAKLFRGDTVSHYRYRPGDTVIDDFVEFSGIPLDVVTESIENYRRINAEDWHAFRSKSFADRAAVFYESSQNYIFDTLSANPHPRAVVEKLDRFNPQLIAAIRNHPGETFLDFGGGIGLFCEVAARMGKDVNYLELPGVVFDFARWRFKKHGLNITTIEARADQIHVPGRYDIIYTDAVIGHLPPARQIEAIHSMASAVLPEGLLILLVDLSGPTLDKPMIFPVDITFLHSRLSALGLHCQVGYGTFCSIWRRSRRHLL